MILEAFSAHADMNDIDDYIGKIKGLKKVMLVHGEEDQSHVLAERLQATLGLEAVVMEPRKTIDLA